MLKTDAAKLFGNQTKMAEALGVTKSAISQWPENLSQDQQDRVIGAALRLGVLTPGVAEFHPSPTEAA